VLIVTIDILPGGVSAMRRSIASLRIGNISSLAEVSN
jgi:hypothetical protein